jgi:hypothetical protein
MPYRLCMQTEDPAKSVLNAARAPLAHAMLGYVAFSLLLNFAYWVIPGVFISWAMRSLQVDFASLTAIALPLAAVALAAGIRPALPRARRVAALATWLYVIALVLHVTRFVASLSADGLLNSGPITRAFGAGAGSLVLVNHVAVALIDAGWLVLVMVICRRVWRALPAGVAVEPPTGTPAEREIFLGEA